MTRSAPPADKPAQLPRLIASRCIQRKVVAAELEEILARRERRADPDAAQVQEALDAVRGPQRDHRAGNDSWFSWALSASNWWHGERPTDPDHDPEHPIVPPHCGLVGLALSGGGIRSASVCLGVLQALAKADKLRFIDYLSTVSGGGYIGSSWTALLSRPRTSGPQPDFPFIHDKDSLEPARQERGLDPAALVHVRDFANYLMPRGLRDQVRAPALLLGGIIVNAVLIVPFLLLLAAATVGRYGDYLRDALAKDTIDALPGLEWTIYLLWISLAFLVVAAAYQRGRAWLTRVVERKTPRLLDRLRKLERKYEDLQCSRGKRSTLAALGISLLDLLPLPARSNWRFRKRLLGYGSILFIMLALAALFELQQYAVYAFSNDQLSSNANLWGGLGTLAGLLSAGVAGKLANVESQRIRKAVFVALGLLGPLALWLVYLILCRVALTSADFSLWLADLSWLPAALLSSSQALYEMMGWPGIYIALACALWVLSTVTIDVNITSLHSFYRDRLSRAFILLLNTDHMGEWRVFHGDDILLSDCSATASATCGPYHIINATANSPDFCDENRIGDESQRGRRADFFIFSPRYCGNERLGYCATNRLERADAHMNLGTAMAISAAAAAPNMGQNTFGPLGVFLLGMLNIRLGYWLQTPRAVNEDLFTIPVGPLHYLLELIGIPPRGKRAHVNLSDGGHLDNLGIFELLRRRCQYIIAIDAEADPSMNFNGLAIVQRLARTDLGVEIHFDVEDLRKEANGLSRRHFALCKIDYGDGHGGELLYIKSSLTGTEIEYIKEYQRRQPAFPHESTGDQFFDETQFEAYRALGYEMGDELIANRYADGRPPRRSSEPDTVAEFFAELRSWLRPAAPFRQDFLQLSKRRLDLDAHLHNLDPDLHDEQLASYLKEIYDWPIEFPINGDTTANGARGGSGPSRGAAEHVTPFVPRRNSRDEPNCVNLRLLQLVNEQIQLIEQAVLALHLNERRNQEHPRNRGWMNLFRRWSRSAEFQKYWAVSIANYSDTLLVFCKYALRLEFDCFWQDHGETTRAEDAFLCKFDHSERWFGFVAPRPLEMDVDTYQPGRSDLKTCVAAAAIDRATSSEPELRTFRVRRPYRNLRLSEPLLYQLPTQVQMIRGIRAEQTWRYRLDDDPELREGTKRLKRILSRHKQFREASETAAPV